MAKHFATCAAFFGFLGVLLGAFAAHALKTQLGPEMFAIFEVGNRYLMYHALALFAVAWVETKWGSPWILASGWFFIVGIVLFSGSLYILTLTGVRAWGAVTPLGGFALLLGWFSLLWGMLHARG